MHVRIAWQMYNHQQKTKPSSLSAPTAGKPPDLRPLGPGPLIPPANPLLASIGRSAHDLPPILGAPHPTPRNPFDPGLFGSSVGTAPPIGM